MPPRLVITRGARDSEARLLHHLAELFPSHLAARALARPVRVVVASLPLRDHLVTTVLRHFARPLAGLEIQTLYATALTVLRRAGQPAVRGAAILPLLVRRFARRTALGEALGPFAEAYGSVVASVRDFLDAGLEAAHGEALAELLASATAELDQNGDVERASAVVQVALATQVAMEELGLEHRAAVLRRAQSLLDHRASTLLPSRAILIHGFADATGVVTDFLEALLRSGDSTFYLDRPAAPGGGREEAFTRRLASRLGQLAAATESSGAAPVAAPPEIFAAPHIDAEVREIAYRVSALLRRGVEPESIAVVWRDPRPQAAAIRRHFHTLGIPFSGALDDGPAAPVASDLAALVELLRDGQETRLERWLDILHRRPATAPEAAYLRSSWQLKFFARGASRLSQVEAPAAAGSNNHDSDDSDGELWPSLAAATVARHLGAWRQQGVEPLAGHADRLLTLVDQHLGWRQDLPARQILTERLAELAVDLPGDLALTLDEITLLLAEGFDRRARLPLGGRGAGVRILAVLAARGLAFEHLFIAGLHRQAFPRPIHEDPLVPDRLRLALAGLLPDLPIKASGHDEERYLFAQLLSAAPQLTLSWAEEDASGRRLGVSPLVERLGTPTIAQAARLEIAVASDPDGTARCRPLAEEAAAYGLYSDRQSFAPVFALAVGEAWRELATACSPAVLPAAAAVADARLRVLDELDPDRASRAGARRSHTLGPYFGFIGPPDAAADPRHRPLSVTTLEALAACPWQTFLRRLLAIAPSPDPLASLPALRGRLVGDLVHRVLERLVAGYPAGSAVAWPQERHYEQLLRAEGEAVMAAHGLELAGLGRAAIELARPYLEVARRLDWLPRPPRVIAAEVGGSFAVAGRRIHFRADRLDHRGAGHRYTDYKTGAPPPATGSLADRVATGQWLQAAAYAAAIGEVPAEGRYVFLRPDLGDERRIVVASPTDVDLRRHLRAASTTLLRAWQTGSLLPRLVEPDEDVEPRRCRHCEVAAACLRRDSGARGRLRRWAEVQRQDRDSEVDSEVGDDPLAAAAGVWNLGRKSATKDD